LSSNARIGNAAVVWRLCLRKLSPDSDAVAVALGTFSNTPPLRRRVVLRIVQNTSLFCSGISHHTAPVALRERLSFSSGAPRELLTAPWFREATAAAGVAEVALLSTCNRTELYFVRADANADANNDDDFAPELAALFARIGGVCEEELASHLYSRSRSEAVRHLCRVASGLDSMVVGETEVLGQVATALGDALESNTAGAVLDSAFHTALRAGRRARAETGISRRSASVAAEGARLLADLLPAAAAHEVLVLGTGAMGRAIARVLAGRDSISLRIAGRGGARSRELAAEVGAEFVEWSALETAIATADGVVAATAAPHAVITEAMVRRARTGRPDVPPQLFVDVGVPRNIEPSVRGIPGVQLYDLDQLQTRIEGNIETRMTEVPSVEAIIEEEIASFETWQRGSQLRPVLSALREKSEAIRASELERHLDLLADATPDIRAALERLSRDLVTKLLHEPSRRLRAENDPARSRASAEVLRELFDLAPANGNAGSNGKHS
jgi:glutamyl-tRNA reductase